METTQEYMHNKIIGKFDIMLEKKDGYFKIFHVCVGS